MSDAELHAIRQQLTEHSVQIDGAHSKLRTHDRLLAELQAHQERQDVRQADDHALLIAVRDDMIGLRAEVGGVHSVTRETLTQLSAHAASDQLALHEQTASIEKLSRRLVVIGSILAMITAVISAVITVIVILRSPDNALDLLRKLLTISTGA